MCCLPSRRWHSHRLLACKLSSLLLPAFPIPAKCTMTTPPPFVPFLSFSPLPIPCSSALCFASVVANLHRPFPLHQITNKPHPNALHCGSPLLYPLLLITRFSPLLQFPSPFLPPSAGFRLHLQPSWLLHRGGQRAHHWCRCFKRQNVYTGARQVRHMAAE